MPDAGNFDQDRHPLGWGEAFTALPLETPDAGGWQRVQARLPARSRVRVPLWLAAAASLGLALGFAWRVQLPPEPAARAPTPPVAASASPAVAAGLAIDTPAAATVPVVHRDKPRRIAPSQRPIRTVAQPADATRIAEADAAPATDLEPLYAQSAQLEELLALARDERVASGTSAVLSNGLDARVASIDAALVQPGLSDAQRVELWGRRVDTLQQLVGIEASSRLYAARGQRYDAALVSID